MEYKYGKRKELQVAEFLIRRKYKCWRPQGSRGPADIIAVKGRTKYLMQVKSTRKDQTSYNKLLSIDAEKSLMKAAKKNKALPVLAVVSRNWVWFISVPDRKVLNQGDLKPLKYKYPYLK